MLQVEAKEKAGKKLKKSKSDSKHSKHNSHGGKKQQGSPSKQSRHSAAAQAGAQHNSVDEAQLRGRSSTTGNQIVLSDPAAAFALVATQEFVRVYSVGHAVAADRTTMRKVTVQGTLQFASAFMACGAPALACLLEVEGEIHLQVRWTWLCMHCWAMCCGAQSHPMLSHGQQLGR